jgi:PilZ domain-containing protein
MPKPPPLPGKERREHPRVDLIAQVQVKRTSEILILQARNVSFGGVFLEGNPKEYPQLGVGMEVDISLAPEDDPESQTIEMRARIARIERSGQLGFGLSIIRIDANSQGRLNALIRRAGSK